MNLYDAARKTCHDVGLPWLDPRTGITHQPPEAKAKRLSKRKSKKGVPALPRTTQDIDKLIDIAQPQVKPCPCCESMAKLVTYDYMTFTIQCPACRVQVSRSIVNERGSRTCITIILDAWNTRPS